MAVVARADGAWPEPEPVRLVVTGESVPHYTARRAT
jgi:hypothetical protein